MAPSKNWDDEDSDSSSEASSPPVIARRGKFDDEEEDGDVLDSWDAAEDSEVEREKAKKAEELRLQKEAEAKANKKTKAQRIEELKAQRKAEEDSSEDDMTPAERLAYQREQEKHADLRNAEDLFGEIGVSNKRSAVKPVVISQTSDPTSAVDLSALPLFNPQTKDQFTKLKETLVPLIGNNYKKAQYSLFLQEFTKAISKELPSDQIKKIASGLTTLSNEKMREEKAAEKGGKKTKAAKTKTSLVATRDVSSRADVAAYDDDFGEDDFM